MCGKRKTSDIWFSRFYIQKEKGWSQGPLGAENISPEEHRMGEGTYMYAKVSIPGQSTTPKTVSLRVMGINRK